MTQGSGNKLQVFVSHKHDDHALAETVKTTLECLSGRIECFVSGSDLSAGSDWNAEIRSQLAKSHLLILLFTEPSRNWDWCLFEAGLFTSLGVAEDHSVVCLYRRRGASPRPLKNLQGVPVEADLLQRFLSQLCKETWRIAKDWHFGALVPRVPQKKIEEASYDIIKAFSPKIIEALPDVGKEDLIYHTCHRLVLDLGTIEKIEAGIPREALVVEGAGATSNFTLALFNLAHGRLARTWGDLVDAAGGADATWLTDLDQHFVAALHQELFSPSTSMIQLWDTWHLHRRSYRAILYQIVREGRHRLGAGASPAPLGRPLQVTIVLDPVSETDQGSATTPRPGPTPQT
jgi:TIR domain